MKRSKIFKITATIILGSTALFWFIKALLDISVGVSGGVQNLILAFVMVGLILLSWKRMLLGGIITASLAVILAIYFNLILPNIFIAFVSMFLMSLPMVISGLLFIEADWTNKVRN